MKKAKTVDPEIKSLIEKAHKHFLKFKPSKIGYPEGYKEMGSYGHFTMKVRGSLEGVGICAELNREYSAYNNTWRNLKGGKYRYVLNPWIYDKTDMAKIKAIAAHMSKLKLKTTVIIDDGWSEYTMTEFTKSLKKQSL